MLDINYMSVTMYPKSRFHLRAWACLWSCGIGLRADVLDVKGGFLVKKKIVVACFAVVLLLAFTPPLSVAAEDIRVEINGRTTVFPGQNPIIVDGVVLVPMRDVFEELGFDIVWDPYTNSGILTNAAHTVVFTLGSSEFTTNGTRHSLGMPPMVIGYASLIPPGAVLESIGYSYVWNGFTGTLHIFLAEPQFDLPVEYGAYEEPLEPFYEPVPMPVAQIAVAIFAGTGSHGAMVIDDAAQFNLPSDIASLPSGELIVTDTSNNAIRLIDAYGAVELFAGTIDIAARDNFPFGFYQDAGLEEAGFNRPIGIAVNSDGHVFIVDSQNHSIRVAMDGYVRTFTGGNGPGHTNGAPGSARFRNPSGIAICPAGNLIVADTLNHVIRRVDRNGRVTTIAGFQGRFGNQDGFGTHALFDSPMGVAVDSQGRIFVADTGNHLIRVIDGREVTTIAGSSFVMDEAYRDRHPDAWDLAPIGGFADGVGEYALFNMPMGIAFWGDNLIIADSANHSIRMLLPDGEVVTLAGTGYPGFIEGVAAFHLPRSVYIRDGYMYIADTSNNMIRRMRLADEEVDS